MHILDLTGQRFGRLVASSRVQNSDRSSWRCLCDCGNEAIIRTGDLRSGRSTSCGCYRAELAAKRFTKHGHTRQKNETREFRSWMAMRQRCLDPNHITYREYGAKGVTVAPEWRHDFAAFLHHVGNAPSNKHTLDRIDNDRGYEPGNVRWATRKEQTWNSSRPRFLEYRGQRLPMSEWARLLGIQRQTIVDRLARGWALDRVLQSKTRTREDT